VAVINPAEALIAPLENTVVFGELKFGWFNTLKNSARNCRLIFSDRAVVLNSDMSRSARPGPTNVHLPRFPKVPAAGRMNALGLNH